MRVRSAAPTDAERIHRVSVASCRAAYEGVLDDDAFLDMVADPARIETLRERLADIGDADPIIYLVAETDAGIAGFIQILHGTERPDHVGERDAYLKSLYVHPDSWGEGIGSALLQEGLARLPPERSRIQLGVLAGNDIGKQFYETHGFVQIDTGTFEVGAVTYETDRYAKELR